MSMRWSEEQLEEYQDRRAREGQRSRAGPQHQGQTRYRNFQVADQAAPARGRRSNSANGKRKDPKRQQQGRVNRAQGKKFEEVIAASCVYYERTGALTSDKTPEPMKILHVHDEGKGLFVCCFEKKAQPDYQGTLDGGRSVVWEAKHTVSDQIYQSAVKDEQRRRLDSHQARGALCFIVVGLAMQDFYRVPWDVWKTMKERFDHKHMNRDELGDYRIPGDPSLILFLDGLEESKHHG